MIEHKEIDVLLCKGSLFCEASHIQNMDMRSKLANERKLNIYIRKYHIKDAEIKRLIKDTGIIIGSCIQARFKGENANIRTSDLQDIKIDRPNSCLYLTTLNSRYVFQIHEWNEQNMENSSLLEN